MRNGTVTVCGKQTLPRMAKSLLLLALTHALLLSTAMAEETGGWIYDADTKTDSSVWAYLFYNDEEFYDGVAYEPKALLASDGDTEAWLVAYGTRPEGSESLSAEGYLVMYIQLFPYPKVIGTNPVGTALQKTEPACEIKLLLDSSLVLDETQLLRESVRERFQTGDEYEVIGAVYLDTPARDYLNAGWVNRIRVKEGKNRYTITCKKRYPVPDGDLEAALQTAREDGFSLLDAQFPAEIDWGYAKMTLSFSADMNVKTKETPDIRLLERGQAVQMLADKMPSEMKNWGAEGWGTGHTDQIRIAGPVEFLRYSGTLDGQSIRIEIWPIPGAEGTKTIVEFSSECENVEEAAGLRDGFIAILDEMGILLHEDALKTELILNQPDQ